LGITSVASVNRQISAEELLAENQDLRRQLEKLRAEKRLGLMAVPEVDCSKMLLPGLVRKYWMIVALGMQMIYLCLITTIL
jgi:hypothetical protein